MHLNMQSVVSPIIIKIDHFNEVIIVVTMKQISRARHIKKVVKDKDSQNMERSMKIANELLPVVHDYKSNHEPLICIFLQV